MIKICAERSRSPCVLPHTKVCGLFGTSGCSEKSEVAKQLLHPKGCSLISLTLEDDEQAYRECIKLIKYESNEIILAKSSGY